MGEGTTWQKDIEGDAASGKESGSDLLAYFAITSTVSVGCAPSMPSVLALGGWMACSLVILFGVVTWYTGVLLLECIYAVPGRRLETYAEAGQEAFGRPGRVVIQGFSNFSLLSFATLFIKLAGINFAQVSTWLGVALSEATWTWIVGSIMLVPYVAFRDLREVGIFSVLGLLTVVGTVVMGSCLALIERSAIEPTQALNLEGIPAALGTLCFMFGGNVIFTHVEAGMKNPSRWPKVLALAMLTVVTLYLVLGVIGYGVYGESSINPVTQNFTQGRATSALIAIITLHLLVDTLFQLISFSSEVEALFSESPGFIKRTGMRCLILAFTTCVAVYIPHFGAFMALSGAISSPIMIFVAPVVLNLKLKGWRNRPILNYLAFILSFLLGIAGCFLGLQGAVEEMVRPQT